MKATIPSIYTIHTSNTIHRKICAIVLALTLMLGQVSNGLAATPPELFNDRAADIIASAPLLAPGLLNPTGLSGQGQIIGIADSGLDRGSLFDLHPDLQSEEGRMPRVAMLKSYSGREIPDDPIGHGTHMAATIVGSGQASAGKYRGIAPGASLYFQALLDENGKLTVPPQLQELFLPAYAAGVRIHINGWGGGSNSYSGNSAAIDDFIYRYPDFLPVFGAGNSGPAGGSLSSEANSKNALTIGNSQLPRPAFSLEALDADMIAPSSSRGPAAGGRIKPELLAPGSAVISACSRLVDSNFAANLSYSLLGGSSMAAAVAGGALALLSEYLEKEKKVAEPSASLLKALLINGARTPASFPSREMGFGILDLAGTVLALQEGTFTWQGENLAREELREYRWQVKESSAPFKATLAWTDPPAAAGTTAILQNDLDLTLIAPGGKSYCGNDFSARGEADRSNNVEQVIIPNPLPGEYILQVKGGLWSKEQLSQSFSLVYGQPLQHEIIGESGPGQEIRLDSGKKLDLSALQLSPVLNGALASTVPAAGSDLYLGPGSAYSFSRIWGSGGVQMLSWREQELLLEINAQKREGGYFLDALTADRPGAFYLNDNPLSAGEQLPAGVEIKAWLNPSRQTLWHFEANCQTRPGFIERFDLEKREIKLLRDSGPYLLASGAAVSFADEIVDASSLAAAFGSVESARLEDLAPGMKVELMQSPETGEILYIRVERRIVLGSIKSLDRESGQLTLDSGNTYRLFPGTQICKDREPSTLDDLMAGDKITALLLADSEQIIQLHSLSRIQYGQLAYFNPKTMDLYYYDSDKQFVMERLDPASEIYREGIKVEAGALEPGSWLRLIMSPEGERISRIDISRSLIEREQVFSRYIAEENRLVMSDGSAYIINHATRISKGPYALSPELLLPGEKVKITALPAPAPWPEALMRVEVTEGFDGPPPELKASAYDFNGVLIIKGFTSAEQVLLYRQSAQEEIALGADGSFSRIFPLEEGEKELQLVALDRRSRGIRSLSLNIARYPSEKAKVQLTDISGHPAQGSIEEMLGKGLISGYPDGSFRPDASISRVEFASLLARSRGWAIHELEIPCYFTDNGQIPWWAIASVYAGREIGILNGYPDGSFRPGQELTRAEMAVLLSPLLPEQEEQIDKEERGSLGDELPYNDRQSIPAWAYPSILRLYRAGILPFPEDRALQADKPLTRAEAVTILGRMSP